MDSSDIPNPIPISKLSSNLHRRNSIFTTISTSTQNGIVPPPLDFELVSLTPTNFSIAYTSLRDLIPGGAINSPTSASSSSPAFEISIRNRLVKHAAWAYLQPVGSSSPNSGPNIFRRLYLRFSAESALCSCFSFVNHHLIPSLIRLVDRIIRLFRVRVDR